MLLQGDKQKWETVKGRVSNLVFPVFPLDATPDDYDVHLRDSSTDFRMWYMVDPSSESCEQFVATLMQRRAHSWELFIYLAGQACNLLQVMHNAKIIYRNFSADSLFLSGTVDLGAVSDAELTQFALQQELSIVDFSAACLSGMPDARQIGSQYSAAPEQWGGHLLRVGYQVDIFSLGIFLWEMLPKTKFVKGNYVMCRRVFPAGTCNKLKALIVECLNPLPIPRPLTGLVLDKLRSTYHEIISSSLLLGLQNQCAICLSTSSTMDVFRCGHASACTNCSKFLHECPECKSCVDGRHQGYFAALDASLPSLYDASVASDDFGGADFL